MAQVYKNPLDQVAAMQPKFNKEAIVAYLKNYGTGMTDDHYKEWATKRGKQLKPTPLNPEFLKSSFAKQYYGDATETYADQYLNDDEYLQEAWPDLAEDATEYYNDLQRQKANIGDEEDADFERSWGPKDKEDKKE